MKRKKAGGQYDLKVTIDRAEWNTGERFGPARLLDRYEETDARCCLGFLGVACNFPEEDLIDVGLPSEVESASACFWPHGIWSKSPHNQDWENIFAQVNDAPNVDDATREAWIAEGFRRVLNVDVEFVGQYAPVDRKAWASEL